MREKLTFYAFDKANKKYWRFDATHAWWKKNDNGCAISIGFEVPTDITEEQLKALKAVEVTHEQWNHSGCQSACKVRGDKECRW